MLDSLKHLKSLPATEPVLEMLLDEGMLKPNLWKTEENITSKKLFYV